MVAEVSADLPEFTDLDGDGVGPDACGVGGFVEAKTDDPTEGVGREMEIVNGGLSFPRAVEGLTPSATDLAYTVSGIAGAFCDAEFAEGEAPVIPATVEVAVVAIA